MKNGSCPERLGHRRHKHIGVGGKENGEFQIALFFGGTAYDGRSERNYPGKYMGAFPGGQAEGIPLSGALASVRRRL